MVFDIKADFFICIDSGNVASTLPFNLPITNIFQFQFISWHKFDIFFIRKYKVSHFSLFGMAHFPSDFNITLSLRFFKLFVKICFQLYQWFKYFFVLLRVFVSQQYRLLNFLLHYILQIFIFSIWILLPKLFKPYQLLWCCFSSSLKVMCTWFLYQPILNCLVFNKW